MALIYYFEFSDTENVLHRCNINKSDFVGEATEINGNVTLSKASTGDTLETIRGGGLSINLEANVNLTFSDFYTENERVFDVEYIRDSITLFKGWLSPEGLFEDFVSDRWILTLNCTDGLGFLKNLSYVENATGLQFVGKQSMLEVISNCLKRTNLTQNIYTSLLNIRYDGQTIGTDVLTQTFITSSRFIKNDETTIMDCDEVLRSILDLFEACITQYNGNWYIYKPNDLHDNQTLDFFTYDIDGLPLNPTTININTIQTLGSQINNFYPHHVNANQQLTTDSSLGAYRINYKYGFLASFIINDNFSNDGISIPDYTIIDGSYLTLNNPNGITITQSPTTPVKVLETTNSYTVIEGNTVKLSFSTQSNTVEVTSSRLLVKLTTLTTVYTLSRITGEWFEGTAYIELRTGVSELIHTVKSQPYPEDGELSVEIYTNKVFVEPGDTPELFESVNYFALSINPEDKSNLKGENHTFQVINKPSTKIENVKEIFNGDNPSDIYEGTIYKVDENTPTENWNRFNTRNIPILRYSGEERMAMYSSPLRVFSGDVYGYIDYFSVIAIDGILGVLFMPIEYSYDSYQNITTLKLKQILNDAGGVDFDNLEYQLTLDYGNVVEPTIRG